MLLISRVALIQRTWLSPTMADSNTSLSKQTLWKLGCCDIQRKGGSTSTSKPNIKRKIYVMSPVTKNRSKQQSHFSMSLGFFNISWIKNIHLKFCSQLHRSPGLNKNIPFLVVLPTLYKGHNHTTLYFLFSVLHLHSLRPPSWSCFAFVQTNKVRIRPLPWINGQFT